MLADKILTIPKISDIRAEAIQTIIDRLGITKAAFFLRESMSQKVDYLRVKDELFTGKTAEEIYAEIKGEGGKRE